MDMSQEFKEGRNVSARADDKPTPVLLKFWHRERVISEVPGKKADPPAPMKSITSTLLALLALTGALRAEREFFVFDNGLTDVKSAEEQAALLQKLGYDGICTRPQNASQEFLAAMDRHGIRITATFLSLAATADGQEISREIQDHIRALKARKPIVWLAISNKDAGDDATISIIRKICDMAAENGLEVVLNPHVGFKTHTSAECERLRKLADRPNLGISFSLCHFLCQEDQAGLEATLKALAPHLKLVQISGADQIPPGNPDWKLLIQPLGQGTFDMLRVIHTLDEIGYKGPVNLQCYQINQPAAQHLAASVEAWKNLNKRIKKP